MTQDSQQEDFSLFTVGHSNHRLEAFIEILKKNRIQVLVDTRSYPYSKHVPHFNREELAAHLKREEIKYLYLGMELGGRPEDGDLYDEQGRVLYYRLAETPTFLAGIERLESGIRRYRVAIMCSEEDPAVCHRHLLIGRVMAGRGAVVQHIRADGTVQRGSDLVKTAERCLFDFTEDSTWKSLRSVSRKKLPKSSSDSSSATASKDWWTSD